MTKQRICNDTEALNETLKDREILEKADLLKDKYFGDLTLKFEYGNVVDVEKKEHFKRGRR